ncbi:MAG: SPOR domain-containing protein [Pseudomonadota bacterium]|nr:SPOR domain-containing protein [Pseudomonadota bacterium]
MVRDTGPARRRPPAGRRWGWLILALLLGVSTVWKVSGLLLAAEPEADAGPGDEARREYLQAAASEEVLLAGPEAAQSAATEADDNRTAVDAQQLARLEAAMQQTGSSTPAYGFYDSLQTSPWQVPVQRGVYYTEEDRKRAARRYLLQAASLRHPDEARDLVNRLRKKGLAASFAAAGDRYGSTWYRVNVGPFQNVSKMNKAEDTLVAMGMMPLKRRL